MFSDDTAKKNINLAIDIEKWTIFASESGGNFLN